MKRCSLAVYETPVYETLGTPFCLHMVLLTMTRSSSNGICVSNVYIRILSRATEFQCTALKYKSSELSFFLPRPNLYFLEFLLDCNLENKNYGG